jgi:hypothetical protein
VLGGSIWQEIYVVQLATQYPHIPILISSGIAYQGETVKPGGRLYATLQTNDIS